MQGRFRRLATGWARRRVCATAASWVLLVAAAALHEVPARSFAWRASGPRGAIYLVGSVHVLSSDFYPLSPTLDSAYTESNLLVEEIDLGEGGPGAQMQMLTRGMLPSS